MYVYKCCFYLLFSFKNNIYYFIDKIGCNVYYIFTIVKIVRLLHD